MKKILLIFLTLALLISCREQKVVSQLYDYEALRDTLGLDSTYIFVKECSPLYEDDNIYGLNENTRVKTLFYNVVYDEFYQQLDTIVYAVRRDNTIVFWGCSTKGENACARTLIEWTVINRKKI